MEEISRQMPVQDHHFQTGLCGTAEIDCFLGILCRNILECRFCGSCVDHFPQVGSAELLIPNDKWLDVLNIM